MALPSWFPQTNPKKLIYQIPLLIIFFWLLMQVTVAPDNLVLRSIALVTTRYNHAIESYITGRNFLKNPSFETIDKTSKQPTNWQYQGWTTSANNAQNGASSLETIDMVVNPKHTLKQSVLFPFPQDATVNINYFTHNNSGSPIKQRITLTSHYLNFTTMTQTLDIETEQSKAWQPVSAAFALPQSAYALDLTIEVEAREDIITVDNLSLTVLTSKQRLK